MYNKYYYDIISNNSFILCKYEFIYYYFERIHICITNIIMNNFFIQSWIGFQSFDWYLDEYYSNHTCSYYYSFEWLYEFHSYFYYKVWILWFILNSYFHSYLNNQIFILFGLSSNLFTIISFVVYEYFLLFLCI